MATSLPQHDPDLAARAEELARARETYRITWHRPEGVASAAEVPKSDAFSLGLITRYSGVMVRLKAHQLATQTAQRTDALLDHHARAAEDDEAWGKRVSEAAALVVAGPEHRATPEVALKWFGPDKPAFVSLLAEHPERSDELFAWQRLGGANPFALRRVSAPPAGVPITEAHFAAAARVGGFGGTMADAGSSRRLYLADWRHLSGAEDGGLASGLAKRVYPAVALFVQSLPAGETPGRFLPVAIQCEPEGPVLTPADGIAWTMAKLVAQCADTHEQALTWHVARCHFVMEALTLTSARTLAAAHPVRRLLRPHTQYTLAIDASVRDTLMKEGGDLQNLLATTLGQSIELVGAAMRAFDFPRALPPADVLHRGLDDRDALPHCPVRDDGLVVWGAIRSFVHGYLQLYYSSDADVAGDAEVRAWCEDLRGRWGARLASIPVVTDRDGLADLVAFALWTASALHATCNDSQLEYLAYSANMPLAVFGPPPRPGATEADLTALYPPEEHSMTQYGFFFSQTQLQENRLGEYPPDAFDDPRVAPLVASFVAALEAADRGIEARNAQRPAPYVWLQTRTMRASIHT